MTIIVLLLTGAALIGLLSIRIEKKKKELSFHLTWPGLLKAFAVHILVQKVLLFNAFIWCMKIKIANGSSGK